MSNVTRRSLTLALAVALVVAVAASAMARPSEPRAVSAAASARLQLVRVGPASDPTFLTSPPGDKARQFLVDQSGVIRVRKSGRWLARPFLDIRNLVNFDGGERGLLSMAFAPDYARSRLFYVYYNLPSGNIRIDEFRRSASDPNVATRASRRKVLETPHTQYSNHNGGQLEFGPDDGDLYIGTGDGGGGGDPLGSGQSTRTLLGKILRIDPRHHGAGRPYSIPAGNPFVGRPGQDEIWHYGLRNPWRFSFDPANGNMAIGDVGQDRYEEVDYVARTKRAANFGWNCVEGFHPYAGCRAPGYVPPVFEYSHADGSCAVTGGYVMSDPAVPSLRGRYVYGDFCTGVVRAATLRVGQRTPSTQNRSLGLVVPRLTSFGLDAQGHLYLLSRAGGGSSGAVYRLRAAG